MNTNTIHRRIGLLMTTPLLLWALTGLVFLIKPGYESAYEKLSPKLYEIEESFNIGQNRGWRKVQLLNTILGYHLLVEGKSGWKNIDPVSMKERPFPSAEEVKLLINDAISVNPRRYGNISSVNREIARTDTGVEIRLDWQHMDLSQSGSDTRLINSLYKIHYLQWLGGSPQNTVLGAVGIGTLLSLVIFGVSAYAVRRRSRGTKGTSV